MAVKLDLKNIISENLAKAASSIFRDKSLAIIDESAENKESLLAAADKVSKRIALFIDTDLAIKVFDILRLEIENRELTPGTRRKHVRVALCNKVYVTCNGMASELYTVNVSAGGMYINTKDPFPVGSKVVISFPLKAGSHIHLKGVVANIKGEIGKLPPGMGIEFKEVGDEERKKLRDFVKNASAQDILESAEDTGMKSSNTKP
jgi:uncharacterized protein (TIGR02266 family)